MLIMEDEDRNENLDDLLNETCEKIVIGNITFLPADVMYKCDPIGYRCMVADMEEEEEEL